MRNKKKIKLKMSKMNEQIEIIDKNAEVKNVDSNFSWR